ncbi:hypothetical protein G9A89_000538 [Geosiphon pyriformis]|nr:hypothetical protein G9A89_000538 [Geosiphon pyriformis]
MADSKYLEVLYGSRSDQLELYRKDALVVMYRHKILSPTGCADGHPINCIWFDTCDPWQVWYGDGTINPFRFVYPSNVIPFRVNYRSLWAECLVMGGMEGPIWAKSWAPGAIEVRAAR